MSKNTLKIVALMLPLLAACGHGSFEDKGYKLTDMSTKPLTADEKAYLRDLHVELTSALSRLRAGSNKARTAVLDLGLTELTDATPTDQVAAQLKGCKAVGQVPTNFDKKQPIDGQYKFSGNVSGADCGLKATGETVFNVGNGGKDMSFDSSGRVDFNASLTDLLGLRSADAWAQATAYQGDALHPTGSLDLGLNLDTVKEGLLKFRLQSDVDVSFVTDAPTKYLRDVRSGQINVYYGVVTPKLSALLTLKQTIQDGKALKPLLQLNGEDIALEELKTFLDADFQKGAKSLF